MLWATAANVRESGSARRPPHPVAHGPLHGDRRARHERFAAGIDATPHLCHLAGRDSAKIPGNGGLVSPTGWYNNDASEKTRLLQAVCCSDDKGGAAELGARWAGLRARGVLARARRCGSYRFPQFCRFRAPQMTPLCPGAASPRWVEFRDHTDAAKPAL